MNPQSYGGERRLPELFDRYPHVVMFEPMPMSIMFDRCVGPMMATLISSSSQRASFADAVLKKIEQAQQKNITEYCTPRDLSAVVLLSMAALEFHISDKDRMHAVLSFFISRIIGVPDFEHSSSCEREFEPDHNSGAILSEVSKRLYCPKNREPVLAVLSACFRLRHFRQALPTGSDPELLYGGLAGILLEGEPGIGKSELVTASLVATGHVLNREYIVLPVAMAIEEKLCRLEDAFHRGQMVVIDEINSASMLEESLNQYLSGYDPHGQRPRVPGFMILATQNPVSFAGRARMSQALEKRFLKFCLPAYSDQDMSMILQQKGYKETAKLRFADLFSCYAGLRLSRGLCFRDVLHEAGRHFPSSSRGQKRAYDQLAEEGDQAAKSFA